MMSALCAQAKASYLERVKQKGNAFNSHNAVPTPRQTKGQYEPCLCTYHGDQPYLSHSQHLANKNIGGPQSSIQKAQLHCCMCQPAASTAVNQPRLQSALHEGMKEARKIELVPLLMACLLPLSAQVCSPRSPSSSCAGSHTCQVSIHVMVM